MQRKETTTRQKQRAKRIAIEGCKPRIKVTAKANAMPIRVKESTRRRQRGLNVEINESSVAGKRD